LSLYSGKKGLKAKFVNLFESANKDYCRNTGRVIDWEFGGCDRRTVKKLVRRLEATNIKMYYTDNFVGFRKL
jgi:IS1 family transposase